MANKISVLEPVNISEELDQWNQTAIGMLKNLVQEIETGKLHPKEMAIVFLDYTGGEEKSLNVRSTNHAAEKIIGLLGIAHYRKIQQYTGT